MKKIRQVVAFALMCMLLLTSCGQQTTYQEQYDLGVRYLSEGNYEGAIIAFTAAIEIDTRRAEAYVGRGNAYIGSGETEDNLAAALADYEEALALDEALVNAWLGLAEVYISQGDYEMALEILKNGLESTNGASAIAELIQEITSEQDNFMSSDEYVPFSDLPESLQNYLDQILMQAINNNMQEASRSLAMCAIDGQNIFPGDGSRNVLRTQYSEYKIELTDLSNYSEVQQRNQLQIEIRPVSGTGYGIEYCHDIGENWNGIYYIIGQCSNWNWNGSYEYYDYMDYGDWTLEEQEHGILVNGLRDGEVIHTRSRGNAEPTIQHWNFEQGLHRDESSWSDTYGTAVFNVGGWSSVEEAQESLDWS